MNLRAYVHSRLSTIHDCFQEYDTKFKPVGQTLPSSVRAYRVEVLLALAEAGIAYNKVDNPAIKRLLERDRTTLGSRINDLAPMVEMIEFKRLSEELAGVVHFATSWDATYRFAEVWAMLVYFFNSQGRRQKRLVSLRLLRGSMTGPETCAVVMLAIQLMMLVLACMCFEIFDRCAVNYAAHNMLTGVAPESIAIGCVSHTTAGVGDRAELPLVKTLVEGLNAATHSIGARTLFSNHYGETIEGHSAIRWYCFYTQAKQQQRGFANLAPWTQAL